MTLGTLTPGSDIHTLATMMVTQSHLTDNLGKALKQLLPNSALQTALDYVEKVQMDRVTRTQNVLQGASPDLSGLIQSIQAVTTYVDDTDALSDLDVLLDSASGDAAAGAREAYAALVGARLQLSLEIEDLAAQVGPPPPPPPAPGTIHPAPSGNLTFDQFNSYLADVQTAIDFTRDNNADLPSASALKTILDSWRNAIETQLPTESSDSDVIPPPSLVPLPTRAVLIDAYAAVDSKVTQLIDEITDILSDRNLEDLTIL